jgi:VIT1/CCC1 family predicted Fe2+/Mn2+ transporter
VPYLVSRGGVAFGFSLGVSLAALFVLGVGISVLTRRSPLLTGLRQLAIGGVAAAVTYAVGAWIGVHV